VKLYGELAAFINLANEHPRSKGTGVLPVRWLRGLEATYTEHDSTTSEKPENRSSSVKNPGRMIFRLVVV